MTSWAIHGPRGADARCGRGRCGQGPVGHRFRTTRGSPSHDSFRAHGEPGKPWLHVFPRADAFAHGPTRGGHTSCRRERGGQQQTWGGHARARGVYALLHSGWADRSGIRCSPRLHEVRSMDTPRPPFRPPSGGCAGHRRSRAPAPWRAVRGGWTRVGYAQRVRCLALGCTGAPWERALTREGAAGA